MNRILRTITDKLLYGGTTQLTGYEQQCIDCLCEKLTEDARIILRGQLTNIRLIQHFSDNKLVVFHFPDDRQLPLFPNRSSEVYAARLSINNSSHTMCDFVFHQGKLSSLEYSRTPNFFDEQITCGALDMNVNMMLPNEDNTKLSDVQFIGRVRLLEEVATLSEVLPPASNTRISNFLKWLSTPATSDYVEVIRQTNGFIANDWRFNGTEARTIIQENATLALLAESANQAICLNRSTFSPRLLVLDFEDDLLVDVETDFITTLVNLIRQ